MSKMNFRKVVAIVICLAGMTIFSGCKKDGGDDDNVNGDSVQWATTFTGTASDGKVYSLKVGEKFVVKSNGTPQKGDAYELNVTSNGTVSTSKGTVAEEMKSILTLAPSNAQNTTFIVMVSEQTIELIVGTITFTNNTTATGTGAFAIGSEKEYADTRGNKVIIPGGAVSCAVRVVSFTHGSSWTSDVGYQNPNAIMGTPVGDVANEVITLGISGEIVIEFGVYFTDGPGNDIYVFEVGPHVEATKVEISADLRTWIDAGNADGALSGVDFAGKIPAGGKYKYVRLTDLKTYPNNHTWGGADVDAVAIMHPTLK